MKKTIKTFVGRLRDAWAIIRGRNYVFIRENEDTSEQEAAPHSNLYSRRTLA